MPSRSKLTPGQVGSICCRYLAGETSKQIADRYRVDEAAIYYHLRKLGFRRRRPMGRHRVKDATAAYLTCSDCDQLLPAKAFAVTTQGRAGVRLPSNVCRSCAGLRRLSRRHGITPERARELRAVTECNTCGSTDRLFVDHCHDSGRVRGVLCEGCNSTLGLMLDSAQRLQCLIKYIEAPPGPASAVSAADDTPYARLYHVRRKYGITPEVYRGMVQRAAGACECCKAPLQHARRICLDHCHGTGAVRGIICWECNVALGKVHDSVGTIRNLIEYLSKHAQ